MAGADFKEIESKMHKCVDAARGDLRLFAPDVRRRHCSTVRRRGYGQPAPLKQVAG